MTLTWCTSKTKFLDMHKFSKTPPPKKKVLSKKIFPEWFGHKTIFFFVIQNICDYSVQTDVVKQVLLVNSISNQMLRVWYTYLTSPCSWVLFWVSSSKADSSPLIIKFPPRYKLQGTLNSFPMQYPYTSYIRIKLPHQSLLGHPVREATTGVSVCSIGGRPIPIQLHQ